MRETERAISPELPCADRGPYPCSPRPLALRVAALFVETGGCYFGLDGVDPWDKPRDARNYRGPWPVVSHTECQRWGRFATNHPITGKIAHLGDDGGCFAHSLWSVRTFGGVIEHPKDSGAWEWFGLMRPTASGWTRADNYGGWTCQVEQGHYGHFSRKPTWLYAAKVELPSLIWGRSEQRLPAYAVARYGYEKARRIGVMAAVGGKDKTRIRNATPPAFRDLLLSIARTAEPVAARAGTRVAAQVECEGSREAIQQHVRDMFRASLSDIEGKGR